MASTKQKLRELNGFVNPMGTESSMEVLNIVRAMLPAILVSILIFMEVELTGVILDKKEFKLKKGTGYNLDLIVVGFNRMLVFLAGFSLALCITNTLHVSSSCANGVQ